MRIFIEEANGLNSEGMGSHRYIEITNKPCPTIQAQRPVKFFTIGEYIVKKMSDKPPYIIPDMIDIALIPWNGFNAISTFSGCGGSSLGYRMAGFKVLYANEFIQAARDSYNANKSDHTYVDDRDIRDVKAHDILEKIGLEKRQLDILDGSPPCASFSTAGKRQAGWGKVKKYSDTKQRTDDLFFEFARLVNDIQPKVFVAENVSGLIKGSAKGYFLEILSALKACGYDVSARVLDAQWLGVPQARQRLIFVGVRKDIGLKPAHPEPFSYRYAIKDVLPWIKNIDGPMPTIQAGAGARTSSSFKHGTCIVTSETDISKYAIGDEWEAIGKSNGKSRKYFSLVRPDIKKPCPTITQCGGNISTASVVHPTEKRKFTIDELKIICSFPRDFILTGSYSQQWERLGRAVPPIMMRAIAETIRDKILCQM